MEVQQKADMAKMQSEARHLQELSARKELEEKMAKVIKSLKGVVVTNTCTGVRLIKWTRVTSNYQEITESRSQTEKTNWKVKLLSGLLICW